MALERGGEVRVADLEEARLAGAVIALTEHADEELAEAESAPGESDGQAILGGNLT